MVAIWPVSVEGNIQREITWTATSADRSHLKSKTFTPPFLQRSPSIPVFYINPAGWTWSPSSGQAPTLCTWPTTPPPPKPSKDKKSSANTTNWSCLRLAWTVGNFSPQLLRTRTWVGWCPSGQCHLSWYRWLAPRRRKKDTGRPCASQTETNTGGTPEAKKSGSQTLISKMLLVDQVFIQNKLLLDLGGPHWPIGLSTGIILILYSLLIVLQYIVRKKSFTCWLCQHRIKFSWLTGDTSPPFWLDEIQFCAFFSRKHYNLPVVLVEDSSILRLCFWVTGMFCRVQGDWYQSMRWWNFCKSILVLFEVCLLFGVVSVCTWTAFGGQFFVIVLPVHQCFMGLLCDTLPVCSIRDLGSLVPYHTPLPSTIVSCGFLRVWNCWHFFNM